MCQHKCSVHNCDEPNLNLCNAHLATYIIRLIHQLAEAAPGPEPIIAARWTPRDDPPPPPKAA